MTSKNLVMRPMRKDEIKEFSRMMENFASLFGDKAKVNRRDLLTYCFGKKKLSTIIFALIAGKPIGFAITRDWMNFYLGIKLCHIEFIFVENKYMNRKIGSALIKYIAQNAAKAGGHQLSLDVGVDNRKASRLYKRLGFKKHTRHSVHYHMPNSNLIKLAKGRR